MTCPLCGKPVNPFEPTRPARFDAGSPLEDAHVSCVMAADSDPRWGEFGPTEAGIAYMQRTGKSRPLGRFPTRRGRIA